MRVGCSILKCSNPNRTEELNPSFKTVVAEANKGGGTKIGTISGH